MLMRLGMQNDDLSFMNIHFPALNMDKELIKQLDFKKLEIDEIYYLQQENEILVGDEDMKREVGESNYRPILELITESSNVESFLSEIGVPNSKEKYIEAKRVFRVKTKLENWKLLLQVKDILLLELEEYRLGEWKQIFNQQEENLLRRSMEAQSVIVDPIYKVIRSQRKTNIFRMERLDKMKQNKIEELYSFNTNIMIISIIDLMSKLTLRADEKDDLLEIQSN